MKNHLRANLWLLLLTVGVCCVLYPAVLWAFANAFFPSSATGSLIVEKQDGKDIVRGSSLIAQPFTKGWYFQPRPSAPAYNATASGASNWGASNPKLRDRVARQLGPIVKYNQNGPKKDQSVQTDIETWFKNFRPLFKDYDPKAEDAPLPLLLHWARNNGTLAGAWVKADANRPAVVQWLRDHPDILNDWKKSKPEAPAVDLGDEKSIPFDDIAPAFFESYAAAYPDRNVWPEPEDFESGSQNEPVKAKRFKPVDTGDDLQSTFFDTWLQDHPNEDLRKVPADMVMASGSGLDPHITMRNAMYQLDRVVDERIRNTDRAKDAVRIMIAEILRKNSFTPLSGLIGEPLVNVLEVNLELDKKYPVVPVAPKSP